MTDNEQIENEVCRELASYIQPPDNYLIQNQYNEYCMYRSVLCIHNFAEGRDVGTFESHRERLGIKEKWPYLFEAVLENGEINIHVPPEDSYNSPYSDLDWQILSYEMSDPGFNIKSVAIGLVNHLIKAGIDIKVKQNEKCV